MNRMKKQEAIELLTDLIGYTESENDYDGAIQMAIEALQNLSKPNNGLQGSDLISRQVAIEAIEDHMKAYTSEMDGYNMARRHMKELIEVLPPAQPEPLAVTIDHELTKDECDRFKQAMRNAPIQLLPYAQPSDDYNRGWHDGRQALREEIWEDGRDRLD